MSEQDAERPAGPPDEEVQDAERPLQIPPELPVLPLRDTVLFPNSFMPLAVAREAPSASSTKPNVRPAS